MASVDCDDDKSVSTQSTGVISDLSDNESLDTEFTEGPAEDEESPPTSRFRRKSDASNYSDSLISDEEINSDEDGSEFRSQGMSGSSSETDNDDDDDVGDNKETGGFNDDDDDLAEDEHDHRGPSVAEVRERKIRDPRRLHPELWFNEAGEVGTTAWLAQLIEYQTAVWEVEGSSPGPDQ